MAVVRRRFGVLAVFSETRYALNGDLRVAYRASREGERDIVFVPNWFTNCEVMPDVPSVQGWIEAMTSLGRLILFDQPGTGASDPVDSRCDADVGTIGRQHHRGARRSRQRRSGAGHSRRHARDRGAVCRDASVPHLRARRARGLRGSHCRTADGSTREEFRADFVAMWGTGELEHLRQSGHAVE